MIVSLELRQLLVGQTRTVKTRLPHVLEPGVYRSVVFFFHPDKPGERLPIPSREFVVVRP